MMINGFGLLLNIIDVNGLNISNSFAIINQLDD